MKRTLMVVGLFAMFAGVAQMSAAADGKEVYDKKCGGCHNKGMMGSPKLGDKDKWAALGKAGAAAMEESVAKGKGKMSKQDLPADDIKAAVAYMIKAAQ